MRAMTAGARRAVAVVLTVAPWTWFAVRDLSYAFDVLATGLPVIFPAVAVGIAAYAAVRRRRRLVVAAASWLLVAGLAVAGPWRPRPIPPPVRGFRIVAANVNSKNPHVERAVADALDQQGDVVLLLEEGRRGGWTPPVDYSTVLRPRYGNQVILSRFPARLLEKPGNWPNDFRAHRLEVDAPTGRVIVYMAHLKRPRVGPRRILNVRSQLRAQRRERESLLVSARRETAPVVIAGDFNTSDRSRGYRRLAGRFRDAMRAGRAGPTHVSPLWRPFLLRIDHVFVPRDWCSSQPERFAMRGSDHRGVAVDIGPCPVL